MKTTSELQTERTICYENLSFPETVRMFTYNY